MQFAVVSHDEIKEVLVNLGLLDGVEAEVGEFATFEIAPDLFDRNTIMTTRQLVRSNPPTDRRRESPGHFPPRGRYGHDLVAWKVSDPHRSAAERARMWELVKEVALALALPPSGIKPAQMVTDIEGGVEKPRPGRIVARQVPPRFAPYGWLDKVWDRGAALSGETVERSAPPPPTTQGPA